MESAELLRSQGYEAHGWVVNITDKEAVDQAFPGSDYYEDSVAISDFQNLSFIALDAL